MPQLIPDKLYAQQPLRHEVDANIVVPENWFLQLGDRVADVLELKPEAKNTWVANLQRHAGENAAYQLKEALRGSLKVIYAKLASSPDTSSDQKADIASKLEEGAANCTPGFHDRSNELVASFTTVRNLDEALQVLRQWIVVRSRVMATDEVHANNRFTIVARNLGFGVRPLNEADIYRGSLTDAVIEQKLKDVFNAEYTLFSILNSVFEQIQTIVRERGFKGRQDTGYAYEDYRKFDNDYLKDFVSLPFLELFHLEEEDEDGDVLMVPRVLDINWVNVKKALLKKMIDEQYFAFSRQENSLIAVMLSDGVTFSPQRQAGLSLFATRDEFIQSLVFFNEWPTEKKVNLVSYYLKHKTRDEQKDILSRLAIMPDLTTRLQSIQQYQPIYLTMAAEAGDLEKVRALTVQGADVNPVLGLLFSKDKYATLWWLRQHPEMREKMTQAGMDSLIPEGKHQGKTVCELLLHSKKGCQLLQEDNRLQGLCLDHIDGKPIETYLNEKRTEIEVSQKGFFKPFVHPKVKQLLQHVVRGEWKEARRLLEDNKDNLAMLETLLTTKAIVTDHAGRRIEGASLQLALGAKDVSPYEHEEMAEMLLRYLKELPNGEREITAQKAAQFPEGWEQQQEARQQADSAAIKEVFRKIGASRTDAAGEAAVDEFKAYLAQQKEQVVRTGFHFNDQLFPEALELCDQHYNQFGGWDSQKNRLAEIKVIGEIECYFTANLAQAMCDGVANVVDNKAKLTRSLLLKDDPSYSFFHPELGRSHFVYSYYLAVRGPGPSPRWHAPVSTLMSSKNIKLAETYAVTISQAENAVSMRNVVGRG
ncbi:MAG: hypothetical protein A3E83_02750 [Gammaproteobacteria bacterium RIFCSPHIGHO2_12_FULL_41_20]|nr:MAG: hypothetical protein A3E83_02750 [Gammaproteobacteria bacterium RIFCSPHIGHO2_12_FULL_41_20]